jgi:predicted O-methyltransferase YrrM
MKSRGLLSRLLYHTPLFPLVAARYPYFFTPAQLAFLCDCLDETLNLPGCVVEVGCARGSTTIFLNRHLQARGIQKQYYALDTFTGFTRRDVSHEVEARGKSTSLDTHFTVNDQRWFDRSMQLAGCRNVHSIKCDAVAFDYSSLGPIALALCDVDLYLPTKSALKGTYDHLLPGGLIVCDDCVSSGPYDGALLAYREIVAESGSAERIVHEKLGVIAKPQLGSVGERAHA